MASSFLEAHRLEPLQDLVERIEARAALYLPDYICEAPRHLREMEFRVCDMDERSGLLFGEHVVLHIQDAPYVLTRWARSRLMSAFGAREKWFRRVSKTFQAQELNRRLHMLEKAVFRSTTTSEPYHVVRGIVSDTYSDIPNVEIMQELARVMPGGSVLRHISGLWNDQLLVYATMDQEPLGLGREVTGFPGVLVRNSDVGKAALTVMPFLMWRTAHGAWPIALRRHRAVMRKIHRGKVDLHVSFKQALRSIEAVWGPLQHKLGKLQSYKFANEDEAVQRMRSLLGAARVANGFAEAAERSYRRAKNKTHNGLAVLHAVLDSCRTLDLDQRYDEAEVAGYVLMHLL